MSGPTELSFDEILKFMLSHNGKVTNHELVKYFRVFLTNPDTRDEARGIFKKHVNSLASINNINNEKWLILKRKYMPNKDETIAVPKPVLPSTPTPCIRQTSTDAVEPPKVLSPPKTSEYNDIPSPITSPEPPQYRLPPPVVKSPDLVFSPEIDRRHYSPRTSFDSASERSVSEDKPPIEAEDTPPKLHPRRKSSNSNIEKPVNISSESNNVTSETVPDINKPVIPSISSQSLADADQTVSVKERKQMFNKMASDVDVLRPRHYGNRGSLHGTDEDDRASLVSRGDVEPLDAQQKQWIILSARGDYNALSKMCHDNPKIVKTKDPFTTAMHWACKHGDENVVKMLAGIARKLVNERSNGGYTPLHLAKQFRHESVYRLLIEVYDADANIRDWSGKKPKQYLASLDTALSPDAYRKFKSKADKKNLEKERFLRIGSLNVRVKKTTEAFSNFLGVGATRASTYARAPPRLNEEPELRKNWGSADNVSGQKLMPPPSSSKVRRRGRRMPHSLSTPSTPDQVRAHMDMCEQGDSDSDSAAGFPAHPRRSVPT